MIRRLWNGLKDYFKTYWSKKIAQELAKSAPEREFLMSRARRMDVEITVSTRRRY